MLGFNTLLETAGLDLKTVKLVRHQDARAKRGSTLHDLWRIGDGRFERYQSLQSKDRFSYLASFVATPANETLFVGLYEIQGKKKALSGTVDPITGPVTDDHVRYDMLKCEALADFEGRLVIDWERSYLSWHQNANVQNKAVIEIRREMAEPPFPGYMAFISDLDALAAAPASWQTALRVVKGVNLLVGLKTGMQYVGSASGPGGFWERWENYRQNGHGGNEALKLDPHLEYQVSILETASSSATISDIIGLESRWKNKLRSRDECGLNYPEAVKARRRAQAAHLGLQALSPPSAAGMPLSGPKAAGEALE